MRVAVLSPSVDRQHGTERSVAEQLERLAAQHGVEIHLYSQHVEDLEFVRPYPAVVSGSHISWHKVSRLPGPHLFSYVWWFVANHLQRWWDSEVRGLKFDVVYSAGVNALNADVISIHVIFHELRSPAHRVRFRGAPLSLWPVMLHRQLYYGLICLLECVVYKRGTNDLIAVSERSAQNASQLFHRNDVTVIRHAVDTKSFNPLARTSRRELMRSSFGIQASDICLLLIGNGWKTKGLDTLLGAVAECRDLPLVVLIVGSDDPRAYTGSIRALKLDGKLRFLLPSADVLRFYSAADAYVGPSLEDAFGLPIIEAMACGLPVIASARAGASEIITERKNGLILHDPENHRELAGLLRWLCARADCRERMGHEAFSTAQRYTWDANAAQTWALLQEAAEKKRKENSPARQGAGR